MELNHKVFKDIPDEFKTEEMCLAAIGDIGYYRNIRYIPKKFITQEFYKKALELNHKLFRYIPDNFKTQEMCSKYLKEDPLYIMDIPNDMVTEDMGLQVAERKPEYFHLLSEELRYNEKFCKKALKLNPAVRKFMSGYVLNKIDKEKLEMQKGTDLINATEKLKNKIDNEKQRFEAEKEYMLNELNDIMNKKNKENDK